jgi:hypothetical protein
MSVDACDISKKQDMPTGRRASNSEAPRPVFSRPRPSSWRSATPAGGRTNSKREIQVHAWGSRRPIQLWSSTRIATVWDYAWEHRTQHL